MLIHSHITNKEKQETWTFSVVTNSSVLLAVLQNYAYYVFPEAEPGEEVKPVLIAYYDASNDEHAARDALANKLVRNQVSVPDAVVHDVQQRIINKLQIAM